MLFVLEVSLVLKLVGLILGMLSSGGFDRQMTQIGTFDIVTCIQLYGAKLGIEGSFCFGLTGDVPSIWCSVIET